VVGDYSIVKIFRGINTIVNEAVFNFTSDGITVIAVDPANVSMVEVEAPYTSFDIYQVEQDTKIGLDVDRIIEILKVVRKRDYIEMEYEKEKNLFIVRIGSIEYQITTISPEYLKQPKSPKLEFSVKATFDAGEFKRAIQCISKIKSESVVFKSDETGLFIEANTDIDKLTFTMTEVEMIEFNKAEAKSTYSLEFLKEFIKIAEKGDTVTVEFGDNLPLSLTYNIDEKIRIRYLLAPRIEAEV